MVEERSRSWCWIQEKSRTIEVVRMGMNRRLRMRMGMSKRMEKMQVPMLGPSAVE